MKSLLTQDSRLSIGLLHTQHWKRAVEKLIAEFMFGDEEKMVRIDMSEYSDSTVTIAQRGRVSSERLATVVAHLWLIDISNVRILIFLGNRNS